MRAYKLSPVFSDIKDNTIKVHKNIKKQLVLEIDSFNVSFSDFSLMVPNFKFYSNTIYLLTGNNGTGKSSFLKILAGLIPTYADKISYYLNNKISKLLNLSTKKRARFISYMPQVYATPDISVYNFLLHARYPYVAGLYGFTAKDLREIDKIIKYFKIEYLKDRQFSTLSGGEQLRILMARIYVLNPNIILFDEPTSFLDKPSRQEFIEHVQDLKNRGKTILIVSHDDYLFKDIVDVNFEIKTVK